MNEHSQPPELARQTALLEEILRVIASKNQVPWPKVLWSAAEIAEYLGIKPRTVTELYACRPDFPKSKRIGGSYRWYAADIVAWLEEQ